MRAMVLAAGLGTRLRPLTDDRPKALVEIAGRTLLEIALRRLQKFSVREVVVNTHHHAEKIEEYLRARENFGMRIEISREEVLLDTGGGLKSAAAFFQAAPDEPLVLHNVDVISTIDLTEMVRRHRERDALATLAVMERASSRLLLFDGAGELCGRQAGRDGTPELARPADKMRARAFCGIHVISPRIFAELSEEGAFPIVPAYLRLAAQGQRIAAFNAEPAYWRDVGKPSSVRQAERDLENGLWRVD
ncbi:MAG TPA: nucleotidyltransferase family protein [Terracidiphilus sp.]|nr:nucleotidyltransferase family protein [Terracidiphilus sp.]